MSIKNILVTYNGTASSDAAAQAAILIQKKYAAHVTGILTQCFETPAGKNGQSWMPKAIFTAIAQAEKEEREKLKAQFYKITAPVIPADKLHWIAERGDPDSAVADYSSLFDLTVIGRRDVLNNPDHLDLHPDKIALRSGRPVLVIPKDHSIENLNDHAIIAWDGRRAAARALSDAMNILETKKLVTILSVETSKSRHQLSGINIEQVLERHGIKTQSVILKASKTDSVEKLLIDYLNSVPATLLVMGAYEQSKFRKRSTHSLSNRIMQKTNMTVFMSY
jgi:nucleotide-binding universal stress UspA family protein